MDIYIYFMFMMKVRFIGRIILFLGLVFIYSYIEFLRFIGFLLYLVYNFFFVILRDI